MLVSLRSVGSLNRWECFVIDRASKTRSLAALLALGGVPACSRPAESLSQREALSSSSTSAPSASHALRSTLARRSLDAHGADSRAALERAPLPVLLFSDPLAASASVVTAGPAWYAISARVGERTLSLHVVREARGSSDEAPAGHSERVRGAPAMVLFNEGVRSVTWSERGATYALEVECYRPFEDEACVDRGYVLALAESLVSVSDAMPSAGSVEQTASTRAGTR
jgi:hypothetical protein